MTDTGAAPASAATTTGGNTPAAPPSSSPTTFKEAFAADASPAPGPSAPVTASPEGPAAATPEVTPALEDPRSPFIPRARFDEVNTRMATAETSLKAFRDVLGNLPIESVREGLTGLREAARDPEGFLLRTALQHADPVGLFTKLADAIRANPQHKQALSSYAAKQLAALRGQQEPGPDLEYETADGNRVQTYSAGQLAKREAWLRHQIEQSVDQRVAPLQQDADARAKAAQAEREHQQTETWVTSTVTDALEREGLAGDGNEANRQALGQWLSGQVATLEASGRTISGHDMERLIDRGWRAVVLPKILAGNESKVLDDLKQKAHASTGVSPGSVATTTPRQITSFKDKALQW